MPPKTLFSLLGIHVCTILIGIIFFFLQMFGRTVASSGSQRHFRFVQDTEDMMVKVLFWHIMTQISFIRPVCVSYWAK